MDRIDIFQIRHTVGYRPMKRCSALLILRKVNQNNKIAPHTNENGYYQKVYKLQTRRRCEEKRIFVCCWWRNWYSHSGKPYGKLLQNTINKTAMWSNNSTPGYISKENESINLKRYMHLNIHSSIIYNSQDMEAAQMSINR